MTWWWIPVLPTNFLRIFSLCTQAQFRRLSRVHFCPPPHLPSSRRDVLRNSIREHFSLLWWRRGRALSLWRLEKDGQAAVTLRFGNDLDFVVYFSVWNVRVAVNRDFFAII